MAQSKELIMSQVMMAPDFITELLPSTQRVSLLYQLSYLCLAKFPKCERMIRTRALETRMLYSSSEAVLLKCMGTSQNLVSALFPQLISAVEKKDKDMGIHYLEKARKWINGIIQDVEKIVKRYDQHNKDVNETTCDILTEKRDTEIKAKELNTEVKVMRDALKKLEDELNKTKEEIEEKGRQIDRKSSELEEYVREVINKDRDLGIFAAVVPFIGAIVKCICNLVTGPGVAAKTRVLENELNRLNSEKAALRQQEWTLQIQIIDEGMVLAKKEKDLGIVPNPNHLGEVQRYLSKIQNILIQLKSFWEKVQAMLEVLQDKTFVHEYLVNKENEAKPFVLSIQEATKVWNSFRCFCGEATGIFKKQTEEGYNFLETDPSSLSEEAWQKEYDSVLEQLKKVNTGNKCVPAISDVETSVRNN